MLVTTPTNEKFIAGSLVTSSRETTSFFVYALALTYPVFLIPCIIPISLYLKYLLFAFYYITDVYSVPLDRCCKFSLSQLLWSASVLASFNLVYVYAFT